MHHIAQIWKETKLPPRSGGMMDQPFRLTEAVKFIWAIEKPWELEALGPLAGLVSILS